MALLLLRSLLLVAIMSACTCTTEDVENNVHMQENRNGGVMYPKSFMLATGPYASSGEYVATDEMYSGYPIYTGPSGSTYWKIYYREAGAFAGNWVLNGNVHNEHGGTVAYFATLFSPKI